MLVVGSTLFATSTSEFEVESTRGRLFCLVVSLSDPMSPPFPVLSTVEPVADVLLKRSPPKVVFLFMRGVGLLINESGFAVLAVLVVFSVGAAILDDSVFC